MNDSSARVPCDRGDPREARRAPAGAFVFASTPRTDCP
jgi:hypothetical protein